jgi:chemotaxis protein methyltransferase CheR
VGGRGCATGEEVYSLAILLQEEGLYDRCRLYATDLSDSVITRAKASVFPLAQMKEYTANYLQAGGQRSFSEFYTANHEQAVMAGALKKNIVFAQHNLATDASFNEFNVVLCRNVLIYFNKTLQERVHRLIFDSLAPLGLLCLGRQESLRFTAHEPDYEPLNEKERIYRRRR